MNAAIYFHGGELVMLWAIALLAGIVLCIIIVSRLLEALNKRKN